MKLRGEGETHYFRRRSSESRQGHSCDSERELMAIRYGITVKVYDACAHRWIVNGTADPKEDRAIAIQRDRMSTHYDLLIPEEDASALNRSRQLKHILSLCSL